MAILDDVELFIEEWRSPENYIIAHTSGSTGIPKEISLPKKLVEESARRTIYFFNLTADSRLHLCLSPDYIAGKMMIVRAELTGAKLTCEEPNNQLTLESSLRSDHSQETIRLFCHSSLRSDHSQEAIDLLAVVPSQMLNLCKEKDSLPEIRNIIVGGALLSGEQRRIAAESRLNIFETYGMTETASHIALRKLADPQLPFSVLPGISISTDSRGCLVIENDTFGRIVTNDIVEMISEKKFYVLGRIDNIINSGGVKIFPQDIEQRISPILTSFGLGDYAFAVIGVDDAKWGSVPALAIESADLNSTFLKINSIADRLFSQMREACGSQKYPRRILLSKQFPRTDSGKIQAKKVAETSEISISEK